MPKRETKIITEYARMWPRDVLYLESELLKEVEQRLNHPGVYVLYRDGAPYYVGRTDRRTLYKRLREHADNPRALHFSFWNFFSAYVIPQSIHIPEIESVLITAMVMTTSNRQKPKIKKISLPPAVWKVFRDARRNGMRVAE
jgi:hypothetical protein